MLLIIGVRERLEIEETEAPSLGALLLFDENYFGLDEAALFIYWDDYDLSLFCICIRDASAASFYFNFSFSFLTALSASITRRAISGFCDSLQKISSYYCLTFRVSLYSSSARLVFLIICAFYFLSFSFWAVCYFNFFSIFLQRSMLASRWSKAILCLSLSSLQNCFKS